MRFIELIERDQVLACADVTQWVIWCESDQRPRMDQRPGVIAQGAIGLQGDPMQRVMVVAALIQAVFEQCCSIIGTLQLKQILSCPVIADRVVGPATDQASVMNEGVSKILALAEDLARQFVKRGAWLTGETSGALDDRFATGQIPALVGLPELFKWGRHALDPGSGV